MVSLCQFHPCIVYFDHIHPLITLSHPPNSHLSPSLSQLVLPLLACLFVEVSITRLTYGSMCEIIYGIMSSLPMATPLKTCISLPATINCLPMLKKGCGSQAPPPILWFSSCVLCSLKLFCGSCITYCLNQRVLVKGGAADNSVKKTVWQGILPCLPCCIADSAVCLWGQAWAEYLSPSLLSLQNKATLSFFFKLCIYVCI